MNIFHFLRTAPSELRASCMRKMRPGVPLPVSLLPDPLISPSNNRSVVANILFLLQFIIDLITIYHFISLINILSELLSDLFCSCAF